MGRSLRRQYSWRITERVRIAVDGLKGIEIFPEARHAQSAGSNGKGGNRKSWLFFSGVNKNHADNALVKKAVS